MIIGIIQGMLIAVASLFGMLFVRNFTTFFHELGHAIPSLAYSNEPVVVYLGSYGDISKSRKIQLGRLTFYIRLNLFEWNIGMCTHGQIEGFWKQFFVLIGGPIASLLIAIPLLILAIMYDLSDGWIFISSFFIIASLIDLVVNLMPNISPYTLHNGDTIVSDGMQLSILFSRKNLSIGQQDIEQLNHKGSTEEAIALAEKQLTEENPDKKVFYLLAKLLEEKKEFQQVIDLYNKYSNAWKYEFSDFRDLGKMHVLLNQYDAAEHYLSLCFKEKHGDAETLLYFGMLHANRGEHKDAIRYFNSSLASYVDFSDALLGRAKSAIQLELFKVANPDLKLLRNRIKTGEVEFLIGVIHEKKKDPDTALEYFNKAKEMGFEHYALEYKLALNSGVSF